MEPMGSSVAVSFGVSGLFAFAGSELLRGRLATLNSTNSGVVGSPTLATMRLWTVYVLLIIYVCVLYIYIYVYIHT